MPAIIKTLEIKTVEANTNALTGNASVQRNQVALFEHRNFMENGRVRYIYITDFQRTDIFSLHPMDFKDCLSSLRWNLDDGIVVVFHEDHDGGGRRYQITGSGEDPDTHDNNFGDCASTLTWFRGSPATNQ